MRNPHTLRAVLCAALAAGGALMLAPAAEAGPWLLPNVVNFSGTDPWVSIDAAVSDEPFYAEHPLNLDDVSATAPDGSKLPLENTQRGRYRSVFDVHLVQPGTTRIAAVTRNVGGTYTVDGVVYRLNTRRGPGGPPGGGAGRPPGPQNEPARSPLGGGGQPGRPQPGVSDPSQIPSNATNIALVQNEARTETFVTRGAPTPITPTGAGLELTGAATAPTDVVAGEPASLRLLLDGRPAAGVKVTASAGDQRYVKGPQDVTTTTGADGVFTLKLATPGRYLVTATAEQPGSIPHAVRRATYTAVLEVQKP